MYTGLDISLSCTGLATIDKNGKISHSVLSAPSLKECSNRFDRYQALSNEIIKYLVDSKTEYVLIEDYIVVPKNIETTRKLIELGSCVRKDLNDKKIKFITVTGSQLKKYATGKGNSPKDIMIKELYKQHGIDVNDNNVADAIFLSMMCKDVASEKPSSHKYKREVIKKVLSDREKFNW